jgi:hypothetical protein
MVVKKLRRDTQAGLDKRLKYGTGIIKKGAMDEIEGPCPNIDAGRYKFKIEAVNEDGVIIGTGSRERSFPEENPQ